MRKPRAFRRGKDRKQARPPRTEGRDFTYCIVYFTVGETSIPIGCFTSLHRMHRPERYWLPITTIQAITDYWDVVQDAIDQIEEILQYHGLRTYQLNKHLYDGQPANITYEWGNIATRINAMQVAREITYTKLLTLLGLDADGNPKE